MLSSIVLEVSAIAVKQQDKESESHECGKEIVKLPVFAYNVIAYLEYPKDSTMAIKTNEWI